MSRKNGIHCVPSRLRILISPGPNHPHNIFPKYLILKSPFGFPCPVLLNILSMISYHLLVACPPSLSAIIRSNSFSSWHIKSPIDIWTHIVQHPHFHVLNLAAYLLSGILQDRIHILQCSPIIYLLTIVASSIHITAWIKLSKLTWRFLKFSSFCFASARPLKIVSMLGPAKSSFSAFGASSM